MEGDRKILSSADQALAICAVDNLHPSKEGLEILRKVEAGKMTYEEAISAILMRAERYARKDNPTIGETSA